MTVTTKHNLKDLYEIDDYLWIQETVKLLREKQFNELDLENLIEELEDLGNEKKHRVESLLEQVIRHLLLLEYWDSEYEKNANHWESEIIGFRIQLRRYLTTNLYKHLNNEVLNLYQDALKFVKRKSKLDNLPSECPYNLEQLLNEDWFPKQ
jgi:hypothetical protein